MFPSFAGHDYLAAFGAELGIPLHHTTRVVDTCNHAGQASKCINRHKHICVCTCTPTNAYTNVGLFMSMSIGQSHVHTLVIPHTHMVTRTHGNTHTWVICKIDEFFVLIDFPIHSANDKNFDDFFQSLNFHSKKLKLHIRNWHDLKYKILCLRRKRR